MENNTGLTSIRKKNKDVFGRSRRRYPVFIVGAVLIVILVITSFVIGSRQDKEIKANNDETELKNREIAKIQRQQSQISEDVIDIGALMNCLPTVNTVSYESILVEIRDYIAMTGLDATTAAFAVVENSEVPETIVGLTSDVVAYECAISVTSTKGLEYITKLLNYIYGGDTFYYLYSYSVESSNNTVNANIVLYTFAANY